MTGSNPLHGYLGHFNKPEFVKAGHNTIPLGSGGRFKKLVKSLKAKGDVSNPAAVAAAIGRKKYGAKKFAKLAAAGRKNG